MPPKKEHLYNFSFVLKHLRYKLTSVHIYKICMTSFMTLCCIGKSVLKRPTILVLSIKSLGVFLIIRLC